ncbi:MAG: ABC transporter substrate-binding protein [Hydrogenophaga sp.]|uniref:ABC transporter substrate-binding protein n=1 Tax=Hydrogenophaga sp. TaxID=1904254 RepID=UPI0016B04E68|nr:ABC transporter substrate-binding protein [Hydrogenophaga sp.]NIM41949.1 ABC transporter substrate-binding protein [Hydrogenophaga sp.]NIN27252.1 ABC transporter substrate-binding protein [Hydrogenophaga sp.]NIN31953.1 ABC transporter substrate-binding protein [Hydrogenophaga sp.]NIN56346.1 ABC transporter substrate-binding protein [Hydrogenophaga sp.]NIO52326.1 ABC transporter substrate-binding protein [Hydrogenophaga sp.]
MNEQGGRLAGTWPARWWRAGCFVLLMALLGCAEVPQPPLAVGMSAWVGFDPLVLARDRRLVAPSQVKVVELASGTEVQRALNNGLLDAAAVSLDETLRLVDAGLDLRIVALLAASHGADVVVARPDIRSPRDLRGEFVAVEDSSGGAFMLQRLLGKTGLTRADIRVVNLEVGGHLDALRDGRVAAAVSYAPVSAPLIAAGFQPIFSSRGIPGEVVDVLVVRTAVLRERPEAVDELLRTWDAGLQALRTDTSQAASTLARGTELSTIDYVGVFKDVEFVGLQTSLRQLTGPSVELEAKARAVGGALMEAGLLRRMPLLVELVETSALKRVLGAPGHS